MAREESRGPAPRPKQKLRARAAEGVHRRECPEPGRRRLRGTPEPGPAASGWAAAPWAALPGEWGRTRGTQRPAPKGGSAR